MSIKNKVFAAAATLTLVGGVGAAGATSASAATPSAGPSAVDIFSPLFGTHHNPGFVLDVLRQGEKVGQPIILFRASNFDPAEDFVVSFQGLVSDFFTAGLVSSAVDLHYGGGSKLPDGTKTADDPAFEIEYAPYGVQSGLCVGVGATAAQGGKVSLQGCGTTSKTVWIADVGLVPGTPTTSVTTIADAKVKTRTHGRRSRRRRIVGHLHPDDDHDHYPGIAGNDQQLPDRRPDRPGARVRPGDQRLGHELLAPVRADLPGERFTRPTSRGRSCTSAT